MSRRAPPPATLAFPRGAAAATAAAAASRASIAAAAALATAACLGLTACETHLSGDYVASQIREALDKKGKDVRSVTCPDRIKVQRRETVFRCEVELGPGASATLVITMNQEGALSWAAE